jgi:hypothetical protein
MVPGPGRYIKQEFNTNYSTAKTFGISRSHYSKGGYKNDNPGPGSYNLQQKVGNHKPKAFFNSGRTDVKSNDNWPSPAHYKVITQLIY